MIGNDKSIVIADDDRLVLATIPPKLRSLGYTVYEAKNGEQAINLCKEHQPHLAILDIRMPGIDGIEAARQIQQDTSTPFIIFSAYSDKKTIAKSIEYGALGYLVKPIDIEQMVPTIETAIKRAKDLTALQNNKNQLIDSINNNRVTSTAVGIIMERHKLKQNAAFETLRSHARRHREKIENVAAQVITASDLLNHHN